MKIYIFSKQSDQEKESFESLNLVLAQLQDQNIEYQFADPESTQYQKLAEGYGIVETPAVVVAQDDQSAVELWQHSLPSVDQIVFALGKF